MEDRQRDEWANEWKELGRHLERDEEIMGESEGTEEG